MKEVITEIDIAAPPERVWQVLTDFIKFPLWNPTLPRVVGQPVEGRRIYVEAQLPGRRKRLTFYARVTRVEPSRELRWKGGLAPVDFLVDGEHIFELEPLDSQRTHFVQRERYRGLLVPFMGGSLTRTQRGFTDMNRALKQRAEQMPKGTA